MPSDSRTRPANPPTSRSPRMPQQAPFSRQDAMQIVFLLQTGRFNHNLQDMRQHQALIDRFAAFAEAQLMPPGVPTPAPPPAPEIEPLTETEPGEGFPAE